MELDKSVFIRGRPGAAGGIDSVRELGSFIISDEDGRCTD